MNEAINIRIAVDDSDVELTGLSNQGVMLGNETSAPPRGLTVSVNPADAISEFRLRRVRLIQDWQPGEFHFKMKVEGGALVISGVDAASLPEGRYRIGVEISDLNSIGQPVTVEVPFGGPVQTVLNFGADPRRVHLLAPVSDFDTEIRRVITDPESVLDGEPAADWLEDDAPRARRKACLLNVMAKLRAAAGVKAGSRLIGQVANLFFADVDRVYARVSSDLLSQLKMLSDDPKKPFYFEGTPRAPIHQQQLEVIAGLEPDGASYKLMSFRQEGRPSLQAVIAVPPDGDPARQHYADLDLDLGNPLQDLEGALIHFGELLSPGKTDHLALRAKLAKGATADFMFYEVVQVQGAGG